MMRKPIYSMTVSLDGYIAGPDGGIDWTRPTESSSRTEAFGQARRQSTLLPRT